LHKKWDLFSSWHQQSRVTRRQKNTHQARSTQSLSSSPPSSLASPSKPIIRASYLGAEKLCKSADVTYFTTNLPHPFVVVVEVEGEVEAKGRFNHVVGAVLNIPSCPQPSFFFPALNPRLKKGILDVPSGYLNMMQSNIVAFFLTCSS